MEDQKIIEAALALNGSQRRAFRAFTDYAGISSPEPLAQLNGVGQPSMDHFIALGLAEEGPECLHGRTFQVTEFGYAVRHKIGR